MAISLVSVGQKLTATIVNAIINAVNASGRPAITPTSVAGTGVSLSGAKVVASAASSISVNGCFTATYDWYAIEFDLTASAGANITLVLRLWGTDATSAYDSNRFTSVNTTGTASQSLNAAALPATMTALAGRHFGTIKLYGPAIAAATVGDVFSGVTPNPMTTSAGHAVLEIQHRTATAYDGFTLAVASGNLTGTVRIYGIA